jgi:hypothetical protein
MQQQSSLARQFAAYGVGLASGIVAWVVGFGFPATWNGAMTAFEDRHPVLCIVLGVSTLFVGFGGAFVGARSLVAPDGATGEYERDSTGRRIRVGSFRARSSVREALAWLGVGWAWCGAVGAAFYFGGR